MYQHCFLYFLGSVLRTLEGHSVGDFCFGLLFLAFGVICLGVVTFHVFVFCDWVLFWVLRFFAGHGFDKEVCWGHAKGYLFFDFPGVRSLNMWGELADHGLGFFSPIVIHSPHLSGVGNVVQGVQFLKHKVSWIVS